MCSNTTASFQNKVFTFTEYLEGGPIQFHSCGNGRFTPGIPTAGREICFAIHKKGKSLDIKIHDAQLLQWLHTIPALLDGFDGDGSWINTCHLLPRYRDVRTKFTQARRDGYSFDAVELFVGHLLREGAVFDDFILEHLRKGDILTELHFRDIQSQFRPMSEDLDILDRIAERQDVHPGLIFVKEPFRRELQAAITQGNTESVTRVLSHGLYDFDAEDLCLAVRYYEPTIFDALLKHFMKREHGRVLPELLYPAVEAGDMDAVRRLLYCGADPQEAGFYIHPIPLTGVASGSHLKGKDYNITTNGHDDSFSLFAELAYSAFHGIPGFMESGLAENFLETIEKHWWFETAAGVEDYQQEIADKQAQERRNTIHGLLPRVASLRTKLLDAIVWQNASVDFKVFMNRLGTTSFIFKSGTRVFRDISEGYLPSSLSDVISALIVASAMRSVIPPSELVCSEEEFVANIPQWGMLLKEDDRTLFSALAACLWGILPSTTTQDYAHTIDCVASGMIFQELVNNLVTASGLVDDGSSGFCGSSRLQALRRQYPSTTPCTHAYQRGVTLAGWYSISNSGAAGDPHTNGLGSSDSKGDFGALTCLTELMAGPIFGTTLLFLLLLKDGFSSLRLPVVASNARERCRPHQTVTRNCVILAKYMRCSFPLVSGRLRRTTLPAPAMPAGAPASVIPSASEKERFFCGICGCQRNYKYRYNLRRHQREKHPDPESGYIPEVFFCDFCPKFGTNEWNIKSDHEERCRKRMSNLGIRALDFVSLKDGV